MSRGVTESRRQGGNLSRIKEKLGIGFPHVKRNPEKRPVTADHRTGKIDRNPLINPIRDGRRVDLADTVAGGEKYHRFPDF